MSFHSSAYNLRSIDKGFELRAFFRDSADRLWVGAKSEYVRIYNKDGSLSGYLSPKGKITKEKVSFGASVYCMYEAPDGTL
ncbi:MAG: hypothetical protein LUD15_01205 [Bacteroides sp.]|nr:hypothetical protein [Bacteroides sp.]